MLEHLTTLRTWLAEGHSCAAATIVSAHGSSPRPVGTTMLVRRDGEIRGSLTGGCVEGAVLEASLESIADNRPRRESFGYSPEDAFAVGLSCGGTVDVQVLPFQPGGVAGRLLVPALALDEGSGPGSAQGSGQEPGQEPGQGSGGSGQRSDQDSPGQGAAVVWRLDGGEAPVLFLADAAALAEAGAEVLADGFHHELGQLAGPGSERRAAAVVHAALAAGATGPLAVPGGPGCAEIELFIETRLPAPRLLLIGANDHSAAMAAQGRLLGYRVSLCDPRPAFTRADRFPDVHDVTVSWPQRWLPELIARERPDSRTVFCLFSHDARFDAQVLETALRQDWAYVGAMGSRRTHDQRTEALRGLGADSEMLSRLHSPIGLDLGAATPQEIAVAVFGEVLAVRNGRAARPLSASAGPIHRGAMPASPVTAHPAAGRRAG